MKTENDCRCDKRINQLEEALRNIANGDMRTSRAKAKMALEGTFPPVDEKPEQEAKSHGNVYAVHDASCKTVAHFAVNNPADQHHKKDQPAPPFGTLFDGGKLDEPTTPAPTPWEVKEGYWYEQYQLMRERYNRQIGKNTKQAERIVQLEAALDAMVEGVARKTDSKQADRIRELEEHSSKQDFLIDELADSLRAMVAHCEGFISNLKEGK